MKKIFFIIFVCSIFSTYGQILIITDAKIDNPCFGDTLGYISVHAEGGVEPYSYIWNTGADTNVIENLSCDYYRVTVTDDAGSEKVEYFSIFHDSYSNYDYNHTNQIFESCYTEGDTIYIYSDDVIVASYLWGNGCTDSAQFILPGESMFVTVTDDEGCAAVRHIFSPSPVEVSLEENTIFIFEGDSLCWSDLGYSLGGGVAPFARHVLDSSFSELTMLWYLPIYSSTYYLYVFDFYGCSSDTIPFHIYVLPPILIEFTDTCIFDYTQPIDSFNVSNDIFLSDSLLSLDWSFWQGGIEYIIAGVEYEIDSTGFLAFSIIITCDDEAKEIHVDTFEVIYFIEGGSNIDELIVKNRYLYPNPTNGMILLDEAPTIDKVEFYSINGKICKEILKPESQVDISDLENGIYIVKIHKKNSIKQEKLILNKP